MEDSKNLMLLFIQQAQDFGTKILDEDGLFDLIRRLPGKKSKYEIAAEKEMSQVVFYIIDVSLLIIMLTTIMLSVAHKSPRAC